MQIGDGSACVQAAACPLKAQPPSSLDEVARCVDSCPYVEGADWAPAFVDPVSKTSNLCIGAQDCPYGTYANTDTRECVACPAENCAICVVGSRMATAPSPICEACLNGYVRTVSFDN